MSIHSVTRPVARAVRLVAAGFGLLSTIVRTTLSLGVLALALVGTPWALSTFVGWPLPTTVPTLEDLERLWDAPASDEFILKTLSVGGWAVWLVFIRTLYLILNAAARGLDWTRILPGSPLHALIGTLAGAVLGWLLTHRNLGGGLGPAVPVDASAWALPAFTTTAFTVHDHPTEPTYPGWRPEPLTLPPRPESPGPVTVVRAPEDGVYDSLWRIADRELGDGARWPEIYDLNVGLPQPDGGGLINPDLIHPGWILYLPPRPPTASAPPPPGPALVPEPDTVPPPPPPAPSLPSSPSTSDTGLPPEPPAPTQDAEPAEGEFGGSATASAVTDEVRQDDTFRGVGSKEPGEAGPDPTVPMDAIVLGSAFLASVATAAAITRLRRRRAWRPSRSAPARQVPHLPLLARLEAQVRQSQRTPTASVALDDETRVRGRERPWPPTAPRIAVHDGQHLTGLDVTGVAGVGLLGEGAGPVLRAAVTTVLAEDSLYPAELWVLQPDLLDQLGPSRPDTERLAEAPFVRASGSADLLGRLEAELTRRWRLLHASPDPDPAGGSADFNLYRAADPAEALPTILVLARPPDAGDQRLRAVLEQGRRLGVFGLLLGPWPTSLTLASDGTITDAAGVAIANLSGRAATLGKADTGQILAVLTTARGGQDQFASEGPQPTQTAGSVTPDTGAGPAGPDSLDSVAGYPQPDRRAAAVVDLQLVGPLRMVAVSDAGRDDVAGQVRTLGKHILAFLALHPGGVTAEQLRDQLLPDVGDSAARNQINSAVSRTRSTLRAATSRDDAAFVSFDQGRYRLDPDLVDVDLWRLRHALTTARTADTPHAQSAALSTVLDIAHAGTPLADATDLAWAAEAREELRHQIIDALDRLAAIHADTDPERALDALLTAIDTDPYAESLYRQVITLQLGLGRHPAADATYRLLESRLADLDAEPEPETTSLITTTRERPR